MELDPFKEREIKPIIIKMDISLLEWGRAFRVDMTPSGIAKAFYPVRLDNWLMNKGFDSNIDEVK